MTGAVFIYHRTADGSFQFTTRLSPEDTADTKNFGDRLSARGNKLLVGASSRDAQQGIVNTVGFLYEHNNAKDWKQVARLASSDKVTPFRKRVSLYLGDGVALLGDGEFKSQSGFVSVFHDKGNNDWQLTATLTAGKDDRFGQLGRAVAMIDGKIVVGQPGNRDKAQLNGIVRVYAHSGEWSRMQSIYSDDPVLGEQFGTWIVANDDIVVVAARAATLVERGNTAYAFHLKDDRLVPLQHFRAADLDGSLRFAHAVAISDKVLAFGDKEFTDDGVPPHTSTTAGAVFVYNIQR